ncbi:hypothetical protein Syun_015470 [Stephania yunnanensis]|uniref:Uncharacterized protein n=1 Tax=Stephania yunnanensis TaxID=152371 RepID=A0AAP0JNG0_9MAGN
MKHPNRVDNGCGMEVVRLYNMPLQAKGDLATRRPSFQLEVAYLLNFDMMKPDLAMSKSCEQSFQQDEVGFGEYPWSLRRYEVDLVDIVAIKSRCIGVGVVIEGVISRIVELVEDELFPFVLLTMDENLAQQTPSTMKLRSSLWLGCAAEKTVATTPQSSEPNLRTLTSFQI